MFDIANAASFKDIDRWYRDVEREAQPGFACVLVANKIDIANADSPELRQRASAYAESTGILFCETSARTGQGVVEAMDKLTSAILEKIRRGVFLQLQKPEEPVFEDTTGRPCKC
jgi:Ras-related protein Rab-5C